MTVAGGFARLDARIQKFLWSEGWSGLRDAQERAIDPILSAQHDVIVAAATAAGKTEAAFLPALTRLALDGGEGLILYISPLKALINDQFGRLDRLCEDLDIPVWPWHGDVSQSTKQRFRKRPVGVLLITPESLEAMLCNRGSSVAEVFKKAAYFVIDEMHAFIGSERGKQLQSLMHRLDVVVQRPVPRIGLSATLGDMQMAADFLRPGKGPSVHMIVSDSTGNDFLMAIKGFLEPTKDSKPVLPTESEGESDIESVDDEDDVAPLQVARHLFKVLRGSNNLVFPNSRTEVERYTLLLNSLCDEIKVPHEFWPHHGSLSKDTREQTERALRANDRHASAVCTNTLELGIDVGGEIKSVCQIDPPSSVASLRQRLGRSGRRDGDPSILRGYVIEAQVDKNASLAVELRLKTVQMVATLSLLLEGWFEPPATGGLHLSTLVQQLLSVIAQHSGATISQIHRILCSPGAPFAAVSKDELVELIRALGASKMLMQDSSGDLLHGEIGEREVNHYSFFAAFSVDEEYKVSARGRIIGSMPISSMLMAGQRILFGGKRWTIDSIDDTEKVLSVKRSKGGAKPIFSGGAGRVHSRIRQRMHAILSGDDVPAYLDTVARRFLAEGRSAYAARGLKDHFLVDNASGWYVLTWMGDQGNEALACLMKRMGWTTNVAGPGVEVQKGGRDRADLMNALCRVATEPAPSLDALLADVSMLQREKWDKVLPDGLLRKTYASLNLNVNEAKVWAASKTRGLVAEPVAESDDRVIVEMIRSAARDLAERKSES